MAKYNYIELSQKKVWTEKEMKAYLKFLNNSEDEQLKKAVSKSFEYNPKIYDGEGIRLERGHVDKGTKYLYGLGYTPKGKERKNTPYGYSEMESVKHIITIKLIGIYDAGNMFRSFYVPLYRVYTDGERDFEYYVSGGKIHIVG